MKPVDIFHIGPQKSGTTWVYRCLQEHPEMGCPVSDSIHYFDMHHHKGRLWYASHFKGFEENLKLIDPTYSYIRSIAAPERIARENPMAKIIICLRHPIERAFSHYWHEKKKRRYNFSFPEVLENYDLFANWIEPGFYSRHIERYLEYFPREQILCQVFDLLTLDPKAFLVQLLKFIEVDTNFTPSLLHTPINIAKPAEFASSRIVKGILRPILEKTGLLNSVYRLMATFHHHGIAKEVRNNFEKLSDVPADVIDELKNIYNPEIIRLEGLLGLDLKHWIKFGERNG